MSSIRLSKTRIEHSFSIVPNSLTFSESLTLSEKGALIWLLAKPENFGINTKSLATHWHVGVHTVKRISKKLQETGYLEIQKFSTGETIWHITDTPIEPLGTVLDDTGQHPHVEKRHKDSNGGIEPHVEKPHVGNRHALERTDLLSRTDLKKDTCSPEVEPMGITDFELLFPMLKKAWPNNNNMKRAESPFRALIKNKSHNESVLLIEHFKWDIQERLKAQQLGFNNMMLSTYLNGERWKDDITNGNNESVPELDAAKLASDAKSRELFNR